MRLSRAQLAELMSVAVEAARSAGAMIAQARPSQVERKKGGSSPVSQIVTEIDRRSEAIIVEKLQPARERFDLGLLTEEQEDSGDRLRKDYFWCIDPLDGTLPFVERNEGHAVAVALVSRNGVPVVGVAHDPSRAVTYHAAQGLGLFVDGERWEPQAIQQASKLHLFTDPTYAAAPAYPEMLERLSDVASALGLSGVEAGPVGGAVLNACRVLAHPPACYFKFPKPTPGGGSLWDFAATACMFAESGAVATDMSGDPLDLNRPDSTFMNHRGVLLATHERLGAALRDADWPPMSPPA